MVNLKMEASGGESQRPSGSGQSSHTGQNEQNKQNKIDQRKMTRVNLQNKIGAGAFNIHSSYTTKCQDPGHQV